MREFTISREKWLRGEGHQVSFLIRGFDKKQCCLGFYLEACGVSSEILRDLRSPQVLFDDGFDDEFPEEASWLLSGDRTPFNSDDGNALMVVNDTPDTPGLTREESIAEKFLEHDVLVTFVD
jgi:hypothetical protein